MTDPEQRASEIATDGYASHGQAQEAAKLADTQAAKELSGLPGSHGFGEMHRSIDRDNVHLLGRWVTENQSVVQPVAKAEMEADLAKHRAA